MRPRLATFRQPQHRWVRQWRTALGQRREQSFALPAELRSFGPGDRARLRRASNGLELAADPAALVLARGLVQRRERAVPTDSAGDYYRLAIVAGVLANVDDDLDEQPKDDGEGGQVSITTLARRLGHADDGAPIMSALRFRRVQAATDPEDLLRQWRRAVQLARRRVHAASLADDLYTWLMELERPARHAADSVRFHWAYDYYQQPRDIESGGESSPAPEAAG